MYSRRPRSSFNAKALNRLNNPYSLNNKNFFSLCSPKWGFSFPARYSRNTAARRRARLPEPVPTTPALQTLPKPRSVITGRGENFARQIMKASPVAQQLQRELRAEEFPNRSPQSAPSQPVRAGRRAARAPRGTQYGAERGAALPRRARAAIRRRARRDFASPQAVRRRGAP